MISPKFQTAARKLLMLLLAMVLTLGIAAPAYATGSDQPHTTVNASHRDAEFTYELYLTDQNGMAVTNPRKLAAGDTVFVELRLTRNGYNSPSYVSYGIEFRLMTRGLTYNYDGTTLRGGTDVREIVYTEGNSVGFAWYDMQRIGENINNPVLAASWSYTVDDPGMVNITVPVALIYITNESTDPGDSNKPSDPDKPDTPGNQEGYVPVGPATLYLDPNGGKIDGVDVSGTYTSGDVVILPDAQLGDAVFAGWSDGAKVYPPGSEYTVSGIVTLTAVWEELDRNRYLTLDPKGGELLGEDITGYYADGEIVILPGVIREGYRFNGWNDGMGTYGENAEYTVYNTVTITAQWEPDPNYDPDAEHTDSTERGEGCIICGRDRWVIPVIRICWICLLILLLLIFLLILLLWKRRWVKYSLVNGDVKLRYKNGENEIQIAVALIDEEDNQHPLGKSGTVKAKRKVSYISNLGRFPIAPVEPGKYKGRLIIMEGEKVTVKNCRIKALDKKLNRKFRK